jgi:Ca2+-transporting ATPase
MHQPTPGGRPEPSPEASPPASSSHTTMSSAPEIQSAPISSERPYELSAGPALIGADEPNEAHPTGSKGGLVDNYFAFAPGTLFSLVNDRSLPDFQNLGGLAGLEAGLRTNRHCGLSVDETTLDAYVSHEDLKSVTAGSLLAKPSRISTMAPSLYKHRTPDLHADRKKVFGDNHVPAKVPKTFVQLLWATYNDKVLMLLTAAAVISLAVSLYQTFGTPRTASNPPVQWVEGVAIIVAIVVIVLVGSVNDYQKERQFLKLNEKKRNRDVKVVRSGKSRLISIFDVLVGDVVHLEPGDVIPADGVFIDGQGVKCDESSATGESELVHKNPADEVLQAIPRNGTEIHLDPFIVSGAIVSGGVGTYLVTGTGVNSSYGRILASLNDEPEATPLQLRLDRLAKYISNIGASIALAMFVALFIKFCVQLRHSTSTPAEKGQQFINVFIITLTVLVIAVPEGLPLAVTLTLAFATIKMVEEHNLVRRLKACETMGNATAVCSDKTGTLTQNKMQVVVGVIGTQLKFRDNTSSSPSPVESIESATAEKRVSSNRVRDVHMSSLSTSLSKDTRDLLRDSIAINTTAFEGEKDGRNVFIGGNTEGALLSLARDRLGMGAVSVERSNAKVVHLMPFDASRQCMATAVQLSNDTYRVYIKGAPEVLLDRCTGLIQETTAGTVPAPITAKDIEYLKETFTGFASRSLRTMGLFYREFDQWPPPSMQSGMDFESLDEMDLGRTLESLVFVAAFGIQDPLRPGIREAVQDCQKAGVVVRMVTGDNIWTARAIATECGILSDGVVLDGAAFRALGPLEMRNIIPRLQVLARASPQDKLILVQTLKSLGEVVAVTGDGTNDAPALAAADIGFSMGISGTEVAKEAASIILMDDNFASIVKAIAWGRAVNDAVRKFLQVMSIFSRLKFS